MSGWVKGFEAACDRQCCRLERPAVTLAFVFLLLFWIFLQALAADPDLFARLAVGRLIAQTGIVSLGDPFAFTPKKAVWVDHEWLAGYGFYWLHARGGDLALFLFKCMCAFCSLAIMYRTATLYRGSPAGFWPTVISAFSCAYIWNSTVRAQIFTYLFLPVFLFAFVAYSRTGSRKPLFFLPAVMLVWANAHGGFVVGLGLYLIYCAAMLFHRERALWPLLLSLALCGAATCVNPYGPALFWGYMHDALAMARPAISEWMPLRIFSLEAVIPNLWTVLLAVGIYRNRKGLDWAALAMMAASFYFGYRHSRLTAIYMMVSYVYGLDFLKAGMAAIFQRVPRFAVVLRRSAAAAVSGAVVLLGFLCIMEFRPLSFSLGYEGYPVAAMEWLGKNRLGGRLLVDFNNGSYALWRLYPHFLVSLDGRYEEVYPEETLSLVRAAMDPKHKEHSFSLEAVRPDFMLVPKAMPAFKHPDSFWGGWNVAYRDPEFLLLERRTFMP